MQTILILVQSIGLKPPRNGNKMNCGYHLKTNKELKKSREINTIVLFIGVCRIHFFYAIIFYAGLFETKVQI